MVLINGQKFACDSCIRGHRSSSCSHTSGRTLHLVRAKGRPASQCETCRAKRKEKGIHAKCLCGGGGGGSPSGSKSPVEADARSKTEQWKPSTEPVLPVVEKHSLEALMNPCRCRTTGICICCKTNGDSQAKDVEENGASSSLCAATSTCCSGDGAGGGECCGSTATARATAAAPSSTISTTSGIDDKPAGCCSTKASKAQAAWPSPPLPASASSTTHAPDYIDSVLASAGIEPLPITGDCQCGPGCRCDGCLSHGDKRSESNAASSSAARRSPSSTHGLDCPTRCETCMSCDLGLLLPSGIDEVERFMKGESASASVSQPSGTRKEGVRRSRSAGDDEGVDSTSPSKRQRRYDGDERHGDTAARGKGPTSSSAALETFHATHIDDPATRAWFASSSTSASHGTSRSASHASATSRASAEPRTLTLEQAEDAWSRLRPGETVEEWQVRHGVEHLTPAGLGVLDTSRRFREGRGE